jgi:hypothetical protein
MNRTATAPLKKLTESLLQSNTRAKVWLDWMPRDCESDSSLLRAEAMQTHQPTARLEAAFNWKRHHIVKLNRSISSEIVVACAQLQLLR